MIYVTFYYYFQLFHNYTAISKKAGNSIQLLTGFEGNILSFGPVKDEQAPDKNGPLHITKINIIDMYLVFC